MTEFGEIPVLDLAPMIAGANTATLAAAFAKAYGETGFAYVVNHGIDPALRAAVFEASERFHALPEADKRAIALDINHRGYIAINTSTDVNSDLAKVTKPNQSASFMLMREDAIHDEAAYLSGPNQWPDLAGFRPVCEAYVAAMTDLGRSLMGLALDALDVTDRSVLASIRAAVGLDVLQRHVPGEEDPGVLADLGDEGVDHRLALGLGVDGGEMRLGIAARTTSSVLPVSTRSSMISMPGAVAHHVHRAISARIAPLVGLPSGGRSSSR
jgi:hypothetical protein